MAQRKKLSRGGSRRLFNATANKTHIYNKKGNAMRGGTRL